MSKTCKFEQHETVMALDQNNIYEAKILKVQVLDGVAKYFIHYNGWAKKYDCWMEENHLAKLKNEKELAKLKELAEQFLKIGSKNVTQAQEEFISSLQKKEPGVKGKRKASEALSNASNEADEIQESSVPESKNVVSKEDRKRRRKTDEQKHLEVIKKRKDLLRSDLIDEEDPEISSKMPIPLALKRFLVEDWKAVTKNPQKLIDLPMKPHLTVEAAIDAFLEKNAKSKEVFSLYSIS